jgi:hypothetical protein
MDSSDLFYDIISSKLPENDAGENLKNRVSPVPVHHLLQPFSSLVFACFYCPAFHEKMG